MATTPVSPGLARVMETVRSMYSMDSEMTRTAIARMRSDMPRPTCAAPDPIIDRDRRQDLFRRFIAISNEFKLGKPNTLALCLFFLLPLERLEYHLNIASDKYYAHTMHDIFCASAYTGLKIFLTKLPFGTITSAHSPSANTPSAAALPARHQAAVLASSPLAQPPINVSPSPEPDHATTKRKAAWDPNWDGPSARTRQRVRNKKSALPPPSPPPVSTSASLGPTIPVDSRNVPASMTPIHPASRNDTSPSTPPYLAAAIAPGSPFAPPSPTPSFIERRHAAVAAARARDKQCVLTGHPLVQAAHIYPFSATKLAYYAASGASVQATTRHAAIGNLLGLWGNNLENTWHTLCNNRDVSETAQNLLCLDHYLHALWGRAYFGLEPLAQREATAPDGTGAEIDIRFHWLYRGTRRPRDPVDDADDATLAAVCGQPGDFPLAPVAHRCSGIPLETGHVFTVRANNADELPSFALLEVQWHLTRLAAMSGAADVDDDDDDDDDNDDIGRAASEDTEVSVREEDVFVDVLHSNVLFDTDIEPLDLDAGEPTYEATERGSP